MVSAIAAGCATNTEKYHWGEYDSSLYAYYRDPSKVAELSAALEAVVKDAEQTKSVVPPGVYAEYGYLLLQQNRSKEAIGLFEQEKSSWPESTVFMNRMIQVASSLTASTSGQE
jgi:hypothetical protein